MRYTQSHEWVKVKEGIAHVGISDFAQKELGDIVFVELPVEGHAVKAGDQAVVLESTKAAVDVYSPVSGKILSINQSLREHPEQVNLAPETGGWLYTIELEDPSEVVGLMDETAYRFFLRK